MKANAHPSVDDANVSRTIAGRFVTTEKRLFLAVAALVLLTRLPFLDAGYGEIKDAWRVASAARLMAVTHEYWASRFPPHPVQEIVSAVLWQGGPLALNLATAVVGAVGIAFFALSLKRLGHGDWLLASLAVAFTPQIYINSTNTTDYVWALSFILAGLYFILRNQPLAAGVFVGLAIGARITSGAILLPFSVLAAQRSDPSVRLRRVLKLWLAACVLGALFFVPAFLRYGVDTLTFAESDVSFLQALRKATLETWGSVGTLGICAAACYQLLRTARSPSRRISLRVSPGSHVHVWLIAIAIYVVVFARLPHLPAYLIPTIPFVLLLLLELLDRKPFVLASAALIASSFVGVDASGVKDGPIFDDRKKRVRLMQAAERFVALGNRLPGRNVVVMGHWRAPVYVYVLEHPDESTKYVYLLTADEAARHRNRGTNLYYLPGQRELNLERNQVDLHDYGALPLSGG